MLPYLLEDLLKDVLQISCVILILTYLVSGQYLYAKPPRERQLKLPSGLYLPPGNGSKLPDESEEDIQPGGYTPPPETTTTKLPDESEEDIQPGGYTPPPTTTIETEQVILPGGFTPSPPPNEDWNGRPFNFEYGVKDDKGNDYSHKQDSDGDVVKGEYRTLMADGRIQVVTYTADWKNGYRAIVKYYPQNGKTNNSQNGKTNSPQNGKTNNVKQ